MIEVNVDLNRVLDVLEGYESEFDIRTLRYATLEDRIKAVVQAATETSEADDLREEISELRREVKSLQQDIDNDDCDCDEEINVMQEEIIKLEGIIDTYRAQFGELEE